MIQNNNTVLHIFKNKVAEYWHLMQSPRTEACQTAQRPVCLHKQKAVKRQNTGEECGEGIKINQKHLLDYNFSSKHIE